MIVSYLGGPLDRHVEAELQGKAEEVRHLRHMMRSDGMYPVYRLVKSLDYNNLLVYSMVEWTRDEQ